MAIIDLPGLIPTKTFRTGRPQPSIGTRRVDARMAFIETKGTAMPAEPARPRSTERERRLEADYEAMAADRANGIDPPSSLLRDNMARLSRRAQG